ncbi:MAG: hypothetical protein H6819_10065 [Phycisphaerales bacterium]|nr:hypothetical protein [Phycisphaerales bacterium]MCB9857994.1 hypothetical protein [Phycisphaerales bacterium]
MGLFDALFGKVDLCKDWVADPDLKLEVDLSRQSISGIKIGGPVDDLARMGPPDNRKATKLEHYIYAASGLEFNSRDGRVDGFLLAIQRTGVLQPYKGGFCYQQKSIRLGAATSVDEFIGLFGKPFWRDEDDSETLLFYEFGTTLEWQAEFDGSGKLRVFSIVSPPLLSDPEQREAYGVDKTWPCSGG